MFGRRRTLDVLFLPGLLRAARRLDGAGGLHVPRLLLHAPLFFAPLLYAGLLHARLLHAPLLFAPLFYVRLLHARLLHAAGRFRPLLGRLRLFGAA